MPCMEQNLKFDSRKLTYANDDLILMMHDNYDQIDEKTILEIAEE